MSRTETSLFPAGGVLALAVLSVVLLACGGTASVVPTALPTVVPSWTVSPTPVSLPTRISPTPKTTVGPSPGAATPTPAEVGSRAANNANLRRGPGTDFAVVGGVKQGQALEVSGRNAEGDWLLLANGTWIAARLVNGVGDPPIVIEPDVVSTSTVQVRQVTIQVVTVEVETACECTGNLYNCADFEPASDAQKCYELCMRQTGKDVHDLDRNDDGVACEFEVGLTVPVQAMTVGVASTYDCSRNLYNCEDFGPGSSAQECYDLCMRQTGKDVHDLDRDDDGEACEPTGWRVW
jgi:hypothetical protein